MKTFLLLLVLATTSCSNDSSKDHIFQLPSETQTRANTFGCLINGKIMVPRNSISSWPPGSKNYAIEYYRSSNNDFEEIFAADKQTERVCENFIHLNPPY